MRTAPEGEQTDIDPNHQPEAVNPMKFVAEYSKEHLNFLENAAYLSDEEKERFDYN